MKIKRSERLVEMTAVFIQNPMKVYALEEFVDRFNAAKSSISEDITIIRDVLTSRGLGEVRTYSGARGGVQFLPAASFSAIYDKMLALRDELNQSERLLPGGYIYTSDILSDPHWLKLIGRIIASRYLNQEIDAIITIATKGIPIAQAIAMDLNIPYVIVRHASKVTEGSTVGINYLPRSSSPDMERMELATRSLNRHSKVLIIDDFLRGGGTLTGLNMIADEFDCEVVDSVVLVEYLKVPQDLSIDFHSVFKIKAIDEESGRIQVEVGNLLSDHFKDYPSEKLGD